MDKSLENIFIIPQDTKALFYKAFRYAKVCLRRNSGRKGLRMMNLQQRWTEFWDRQKIPASVSLAVYGRLAKAYGGSDRLYHNLGHIRQCLGVFDTIRSQALDPVAIETAIWFHDVVYNTNARDNEEQSALYAQRVLRSFGIEERLVQSISSLIMATKKHDGALTEPDEQLIADIDLSSLGPPWDTFWLNTKDIRNEYSHVDGRVFAKERAKILKRFLERPFLYYTPELKERYEKQARANLARSIALLEEQAAA